MDNREFINTIREVVRDSAVTNTISTMESPPGRRPPQNLLDRANWYKTLDEDQRRLLAETITAAVDSALFGLFCVIDGVRAIENGSDKGRLELRYVKGSTTMLLNAAEGDMLHDLYNAG